MHGVRLVRTPPANTNGSALSGFPERFGRKEFRSTERKAMARTAVRTLIVGLLVAARVPFATAQDAQMTGMADHAMSGPMDVNMMKHMELSPVRAATHADSVRALAAADELRKAIAKYQDTAAAVAAGYKMFLPNVKDQHVFHFTRSMNAIKAVFRFDPAQPTSLLYKRGTDGKLKLVGAMYTLPRSASLDRLNERVPLGIARWHKHVNWCLPKAREGKRFAEKLQDGSPKFGPESPIATKAECDAVGGRFHPNLLGWMLHANVFEGNDLSTIYGDDHAKAAR